MKPIFFVAKYVRDVLRMEPINVGVILWHAGKTSMKFFGISINDGRVSRGSRFLKRDIGSVNTYIQWIEYWHSLIPALSKQTTSDEVTSILTSTNNNAGNYWVANGGQLLDETNDLDSAAGQLYKILIEKGKYSSRRVKDINKESFDHKCRQLLDKSGLTTIKGFHSNQEIACSLLEGMQVNFKFSYSLYNGNLRSIIEKIPTTNKESRLEQHVHETAFKIEKLLSNSSIQKENALILYESKEDYAATAKGKDLLNIMSYVGNPIDISESEHAVREFSRIKTEILRHS